jgi:hypothetical protein
VGVVFTNANPMAAMQAESKARNRYTAPTAALGHHGPGAYFSRFSRTLVPARTSGNRHHPADAGCHALASVTYTVAGLGCNGTVAFQYRSACAVGVQEGNTGRRGAALGQVPPAHTALDEGMPAGRVHSPRVTKPRRRAPKRGIGRARTRIVVIPAATTDCALVSSWRPAACDGTVRCVSATPRRGRAGGRRECDYAREFECAPPARAAPPASYAPAVRRADAHTGPFHSRIRRRQSKLLARLKLSINRAT